MARLSKAMVIMKPATSHRGTATRRSRSWARSRAERTDGRPSLRRAVTSSRWDVGGAVVTELGWAGSMCAGSECALSESGELGWAGSVWVPSSWSATGEMSPESSGEGEADCGELLVMYISISHTAAGG